MDKENNHYEVLFVDDDPHILRAMQRNLKGKYNILTASTIDEAIEYLEHYSFPVVVSDMKMPEMCGADLLILVKQKNPETIRILLTGESGLSEAIKAINESNIYRFLTKPCSNEMLCDTIDGALKLFHGNKIEQMIMDKSVKGFIYVILDLLNIMSPEVFRHSIALTKSIRSTQLELPIQDKWAFEVSNLLMLIGSVHLKIYNFDNIYGSEKLIRIFDKSAEILGKIPKFDQVKKILQELAGHYKRNETIGVLDTDAKVLKFLLDKGALSRDSGFLEKMSVLYSENILSKYLKDSGEITQKYMEGSNIESAEFVMVNADDLKPGMRVIESLITSSGSVIINKGTVIDETHVSTIRIFTSKNILQEPFKMTVN